MGKRKCNSKYRATTPDPASADRSSSPHLPGTTPGSIPAVFHHHPPSVLTSRAFEVSDSPDNLHSPYHLSSGDNPSLVLVHELLDGSNYSVWVIGMTTCLEAKNKIGFIDGSIAMPQESDPYFKIWNRCNSMVKAWLLNSVTKKIYTSVLYFKTAAEIWKDLNTRFHKANLPRLYKLRQQLHSFRQGSLDLSTYHTQTQTYWEELSSLQAVGRSVEELLAERETNRVIDFLMGLNDSYENVRSQILMKKTLPSLSEVYNILDQEDSQRSARYHPPSDNSNSTAFHVTARPSFPNQKSKPVCSHCGKLGHMVDRCYKIHGYPPGMKFKSKMPYQNRYSADNTNISANMIASASANQDHMMQNSSMFQNAPQLHHATAPSPMTCSLSKAQMDQFITYLSSQVNNQRITSSQEGLLASPSAVPSTSKVSGTFLPLYSFSIIDMSSMPSVHSVPSNPLAGNTIISNDAWVIDSGATHHVCHIRTLFTTFKNLSNTYVTLPTGNSVSIVGVGQIKLSDKITLNSVLYVPAFQFNLLSVSCLTKDTNAMVNFTSSACFIQDLTQELMIGKGNQVSNLYVLDAGSLKTASTFTETFTVCSSISDSHIWHTRLGHPSMAKISVLSDILSLPKLSDKSPFHCSICHKAKQKRLSFPFENHISPESFDLIHMDTWGPFSVPTHEGYRYFLTLVDDHSRATWIYLMKSKSDVLQIFHGFLHMIETQ